MDQATVKSVTPDEARNGWTPERLSAYLNERAVQTAAHAGLDKRRQVRVENVKTFSPHGW